MFTSYSRRGLIKATAAIGPMALLGLPTLLSVTSNESQKKEVNMAISENFPCQPPELVHEVVTVAHFDLKRLKQLVDAQPSLARASWDWGFGDWETALGAASHMGNRPIAEYLVAKGARPSLFSAAMLGQLEVVKAFIAVDPHVSAIPGPHSISLLAHAKAGGDQSRAVYTYLEALGIAMGPSTMPLSEHEKLAILGTYRFGSEPDDPNRHYL
jgi:hypothetical protein